MDDLETGDVLLFSSKGLSATLIKMFTKSIYSHLSIVWRCKVTNVLYSWEIGDVDPYISPIITTINTPSDCAHLMPLETKFYKYKNTHKVWVLKLKNNIGLTLDHNKFTEYICKTIGKRYNYNLMYGYVFNVFHFTDFKMLEKLSLSDSCICSDLILNTLEYLNIVEVKNRENIIAFYPKHFIEKYSNKFNFINGFYLMEPKLIINNK